MVNICIGIKAESKRKDLVGMEANLEAGALACTRLLLHWHDLHDLILEGGAQKVLHNLVLFHREGEQVDLLQALDLALQEQQRTQSDMSLCSDRRSVGLSLADDVALSQTKWPQQPWPLPGRHLL